MESRKLEGLYRALLRIRRVEEEIVRIYPTDTIKCPVHLSIGQEGISVGVCAALRPEDVVFGTYRSHALYLAKGGDLRAMMAELYGKATGCAKGKGGSMHLVDPDHGVMGVSAVVGSTVPVAVGYAYAAKLQKRRIVVASFFGDGTVDGGAFHESLNLAKLKNLPILFICENNRYATHTHQRDRHSVDNIYEKARVYGIPAERVERDDPVSVLERVAPTIDKIRSGDSGPVFFECMTYRRKEHVGPDDDFGLGYRARTEAEPWIRADGCRQLAARIDPELRRQLEAEVEAEIREAIRFAEDSPFPDPSELYTDVFKET